MKPVLNQLCHLEFADSLMEGRVQEVYDEYYVMKFAYGKYRVNFEGVTIGGSFERKVDLVFKNGNPVKKRRFLFF